MKDRDTLGPGARVGVLGSGQLGRMLGYEARRHGYGFSVYSPEANSPAGAVADREFVAPYEDLDAVTEFARSVDVVTFEFENVPAVCAEACRTVTRVHPDHRILAVAQNRQREKTTLRDAGFPVTRFHAVADESELEPAAAAIGFPSVLKTAGFGYDGKGQRIVRSVGELPEAWASLGRSPCVLEQWVSFRAEASVVVARNHSGEVRLYGPIENDHANHVLDVSVYPAVTAPELAQEAKSLARNVAEHLDLIGVLCVEMFITSDGALLVNEIAPRPHNSGHLTIEACVSNQFEQQLRAVCGLPLGSEELLSPTAMANLLGDLWFPGEADEPREPDFARLLAELDVRLHLYGKQRARRGRKMGHLVARAGTPEEARIRVRAARDLLKR